MKKEIKIYIYLFLFLAIGMHFKQWIDHPIRHLLNISHGGAFGIPGVIHPFVFTFLGYLLVLFLRFVFKKIFR
ncbi:MAG: hypothetical protein B1H07_02565 [Campylobacteraceae bacterium 4484_166]|nr:MAG: hypothetical protein B1H07_02565 [Campylobacteraceae bacterium 4484_166]